MSTGTNPSPSAVDLSAVRALLIGALAAFGTALAIHYRSDPAAIIRDVVVYPAVLFVGLALWTSRVWLQVTAAIVILVPALAFFEGGPLTAPAGLWHFLNHAFLLLAAALALAGGAAALISGRRKQGSA